ncbi:MAG: ACP phosphodiesterase [Flavobacteriales bacterium]
MNFLAHFYLSFDDPDILVGQFIADEVKGRSFEKFPQRIRDGILLHRFVDSTTDTHPECLKIRRLIRPQLGLYSPVAIDVYFDHFLARKWHVYKDKKLRHFTEEVYQTLESRKENISPQMLILLTKMKHFEWLNMYESLDGISEILVQMSRRIRGAQQLELAGMVLREFLPEVEKSFDSYFPQLIDDTKAKLDTFAN